MRKLRWPEADELITMAEIITGGLGEVIAVTGGAHIVKVHRDNSRDVIFSLERPEYREWLARRQPVGGLEASTTATLAG